MYLLTVECWWMCNSYFFYLERMVDCSVATESPAIHSNSSFEKVSTRMSCSYKNYYSITIGSILQGLNDW